MQGQRLVQLLVDEGLDQTATSLLFSSGHTDQGPRLKDIRHTSRLHGHECGALCAQIGVCCRVLQLQCVAVCCSVSTERHPTYLEITRA